MGGEREGVSSEERLPNALPPVPPCLPASLPTATAMAMLGGAQSVSVMATSHRQYLLGRILALRPTTQGWSNKV